MRVSQEFIKQLEDLYQNYEQVVTEKIKNGTLAKKTAETYLRHSGTFVRWCNDDFVPGIMKEKKKL